MHMNPGNKTPPTHRPGRVAWWLWPNLLGFDAPVVAMAWLWMFARAGGGVPLDWRGYAALGLAVWIIYVCDRMLDLRICEPGDPTLRSRHEFHRRHQVVLICGILAAGVWLLQWSVSEHSPDCLVLLALPAAAFTALSFLLVLFSKQNRRAKGLRDLAAGLAFGYGCALLARADPCASGIWEQFRNPEAVAFGVLCTLNIHAIHLWEKERLTSSSPSSGARACILHIPLASLVLILWPIFPAVSIGATLLLLLDRFRHKLSLDLLGILADLALLLPVLVIAVAGFCRF